MSRNKNISKLSDEELIMDFRSTARLETLGVLYQRYSHLIYGSCLKYTKNVDTAKDLSMEIFEQLSIKLKEHEVKSFKSWLYILTKNHCLMHLRKAKIMPQALQDENFKLRDSSLFELNTKLLKEDQLLALEQAIEELNDKQRVCIRLFYLQKKCYYEIALEINEEKNKVKSYIQNGKRNLKVKLESIMPLNIEQHREMIVKYHQGKLDASEMHQLEMDALNDPFLSDALDGFEIDGGSSTLAELNEEIKSRNSSNTFYNAFIAPGVLLCVACLILIPTSITILKRIMNLSIYQK